MDRAQLTLSIPKNENVSGPGHQVLLQWHGTSSKVLAHWKGRNECLQFFQIGCLPGLGPTCWDHRHGHRSDHDHGIGWLEPSRPLDDFGRFLVETVHSAKRWWPAWWLIHSKNWLGWSSSCIKRMPKGACYQEASPSFWMPAPWRWSPIMVKPLAIHLETLWKCPARTGFPQQKWHVFSDVFSGSIQPEDSFGPGGLLSRDGPGRQLPAWSEPLGVLARSRILSLETHRWISRNLESLVGCNCPRNWEEIIACGRRNCSTASRPSMELVLKALQGQHIPSTKKSLVTKRTSILQNQLGCGPHFLDITIYEPNQKLSLGSTSGVMTTTFTPSWDIPVFTKWTTICWSSGRLRSRPWTTAWLARWWTYHAMPPGESMDFCCLFEPWKSPHQVHKTAFWLR